MPFPRPALALVLCAAALIAPAAEARTTIVASRPTQGATVTSPTSVELTFSEPVAPATLSVSLVMTSMPGMANHKPMTIKGFAVAATGSKVTLRFPRPLPGGTYRLDWTITAQPAEPASGSLTFLVR